MRKYIIAISCIFLCAAAFGYQRGDRVLGGTLNTAVPCLGSDWGEFNVFNTATGVEHDAKLGDPSLGLNVHAFYFLSPRVAVGLSFGYDYFPTDRASGLELDVNTKSLHYLFLTRIYLNPQAALKFYVPAGVGVANTRVKIDMHPAEKFQDTGFSAAVGLGTEYMIFRHMGINLEARYNYSKFDTSKWNASGQYIKLFPQASYLSYSAGLFYTF